MLLKVISIHAPLVGRDVSEDVASRVDLEFQSTRPSWGATRGMIQYFVDAEISIHAPLVGRDQLQRPLHDQERHFNPRARVGRDKPSSVGTNTIYPFQSTRPCGARPCPRTSHTICILFQSTRPCGARPSICSSHKTTDGFQSTRPCGARQLPKFRNVDAAGFQSTRPCGARPPSLRPAHYTFYFNPRARVGRDQASGGDRHARKDFNPRARVGRDNFSNGIFWRYHEFQSTRPCGARPTLVPTQFQGKQFQSTRPCGARPLTAAPCKPMGIISIHAPVWGATWQID